METDAGVGNEASGAESTSSPQNVRSACLLGQSRGCSLPHPRVMGAGSGLCSTRLQQLLAFFGLWLHDSSLCLHLHNDFVCGGGVWMCVCVCVCTHACMHAPCVWYEIFLCDMKSYSVSVIKTCMRLQVLGIRTWVFFQEAIFWPAVTTWLTRSSL